MVKKFLVTINCLSNIIKEGDNLIGINLKKILNIIGKILFVLFLCFIALFIVVVISTYLEIDEEYSNHFNPSDFHDMKEYPLDKDIKTINDGLPYVIKRAKEFRNDAVLTDVTLITEEIDYFKDDKIRFIYRFDFPYINDDLPLGYIEIVVESGDNVISSVRADHNSHDKTTTSIKGIEIKDLQYIIDRVYDISVDYFGMENILKIKDPTLRISISADYSNFTLQFCKVEIESGFIAMKNLWVDIDTKTFEIIDFSEGYD